jgi:hypothetical protein
VLKRVLKIKNEEEVDVENYIARNFIICALQEILLE